MAIVIIPHHKPIPALYADTHRLRHRGISRTAWHAILYRWPHRGYAPRGLPYQLSHTRTALNALPKTIHHKNAYYYYVFPMNHNYRLLRITPKNARYNHYWLINNETAHHPMILGCTTKLHTGQYGILSEIKGVKTHWPTPPRHKRWK